jgi:hypothetical protein
MARRCIDARHVSKALGEVAPRVYCYLSKRDNRCNHAALHCDDEDVAVPNRTLAQNYMEYERVPSGVIARVLDKPASRRMPSTEHLIPEATTPSQPLQTGK